MASKSELSDQINEVLDTEFDWSEMKKDDLEVLYELLDEGALIEPQAKHVVKEHGKGQLEEIVDDWRPGKYLLKMI